MFNRIVGLSLLAVTVGALVGVIIAPVVGQQSPLPGGCDRKNDVGCEVKK